MVKRFAAASVIVCMAGTAFAAINHGTFMGTNVIFQNVSEDTTTDPLPPGGLFGAPIAVADSLKFNPVSFGANSSNGVSVAGPGSLDITDGTLQFAIQAKPGQFVDQFTVVEQGDYTLLGSPASAATFVGVNFRVFITVLEVNGSAITPVGFTGTGTFTPSGGTLDLLNDGPAFLGVWQGSGTFDITSFLAGLGMTGRATKVQVGLDNQLVANSVFGTTAFIKKKDFEGVTIVVPAPGALATVAMGGLLAARRRRAR